MMRISGLGLVFAGGRGMDDLDMALREGWISPETKQVPGHEQPIPAFSVSQNVLKDRTALKGMRRADRLSRMATLAAGDAWEDGSSPEEDDMSRVGIILATALGPHARTFQFLDNILDFGDEAVSPTTFSHSVHNAAASYVATTLGIHGPVLTVTDFDFAFQQALCIAECWLEQGRCDRVLVGVAEELSDVMLHVCGRMANIPTDGKLEPLAFSDDPDVVPGEGAAFFLIERKRPSGKCISISVKEELDEEVDMTILDAEGLSGSEVAYRDIMPDSGLISNYFPVFGSMMTGTAFQCAVGFLSLKSGIRYATPVTENRHKLKICRKTEPAPMHKLRCVKLGSNGGFQQINLNCK